MKNHVVQAEHAEQIWGWLQSRGGLFVWKSIDLSDPGKSWTGPATDREGKPSSKPSWQSASEPARHITDPAEVEVAVPKEVSRLKVAVRVGDQGFKIKLTDASSAKLRKRLDWASKRFGGGDSWYDFDYFTQEAVIYVADKQLPIAEYIKTK